ncbi:MAG: hypothetical protein KF773_12430 [Deltaproteobacteria bacterium]|nr:hypothetical protein [Deltaproteobacteria bacterium]
MRDAVEAWQHGRCFEIDPEDVFVILAIVIGAIDFDRGDDDPAIALARTFLEALFCPGATQRLPPVVIRRRPRHADSNIFQLRVA